MNSNKPRGKSIRRVSQMKKNTNKQLLTDSIWMDISITTTLVGQNQDSSKRGNNRNRSRRRDIIGYIAIKVTVYISY